MEAVTLAGALLMVLLTVIKRRDVLLRLAAAGVILALIYFAYYNAVTLTSLAERYNQTATQAATQIDQQVYRQASINAAQAALQWGYVSIILLAILAAYVGWLLYDLFTYIAKTSNPLRIRSAVHLSALCCDRLPASE